MGIGELSALTAAMLWTVSSLLYGRTRLSAWGINLTKNVAATIFVFIHMMIVAAWYSNQPMFEASVVSWWWLGLSGVIGIVVGDTLYFRSLQILGPRLALVVATTSPLFAALLGWLLLGELLHAVSFLGIMLAVCGIGFVVFDRKAIKEAPGFFPGGRSQGICFGILAAVCQAAGGALSKIGMSDCSPIEASFIRLLVAAIFGLLLVIGSRQITEMRIMIFRWDVMKNLLPAAAIGTWLGIWFSQIAFKNTDVGIAQTLLSTSPLFAIPFMWVALGHRPTARALFGTIIAIAGIFLAVRSH